MAASILTFIITSSCVIIFCHAEYQPTWESLDTRPLPSWYNDAKIGIFLHWGLYSVPSFGTVGEWFWMYWQGSHSKQLVEFMRENYRPDFTYQDFAAEFTCELYDPDKWADLFQEAGARYVVLTSKHHEGFTMWPSAYSWNWNAKDTGPNRDLLGDLARSIRNRTGLRFGAYYSLYEWFNPIYLQDKKNHLATNNFIKNKMSPELNDLVNTYLPEIVWVDGDWEANDTYWNSTNFLAWLYNSSPVKDSVVVNDRWGISIPCAHGDFYTCQDNFAPKKLIQHKWESATTLDRSSWGFRRNAGINDYLTIEELIAKTVQTISCNGNININIGPGHDGTIAPVFQERLLQLGSWLKVNGEGIYASRPWEHQNDTLNPDVWYTSKGSTIYLYFLKWPEDSLLKVGALQLSQNNKISMLGSNNVFLKWTQNQDKTTTISLTSFTPSTVPCQWAWGLKIVKSQNLSHPSRS